jgi:hypothetical protein
VLARLLSPPRLKQQRDGVKHKLAVEERLLACTGSEYFKSHSLLRVQDDDHSLIVFYRDKNQTSTNYPLYNDTAGIAKLIRRALRGNKYYSQVGKKQQPVFWLLQFSPTCAWRKPEQKKDTV